MEHLKEITQKPQTRPFIKKLHESVFKYLLLNCTMSRDVWKVLTDKCFHTASNPFILDILGLFLDGEMQNSPPVIIFDRDKLQPQKVANM